MKAHQGKKDVSECGSTVLESNHISTMYGRMLETGEFEKILTCYAKRFTVQTFDVFIYIQMGSSRSFR